MNSRQRRKQGALVMAAISVMGALILLSGCQTMEQRQQYQQWYNGLSTEEKGMELRRREVAATERSQRIRETARILNRYSESMRTQQAPMRMPLHCNSFRMGRNTTTTCF